MTSHCESWQIPAPQNAQEALPLIRQCECGGDFGQQVWRSSSARGVASAVWVHPVRSRLACVRLWRTPYASVILFVEKLLER